MAITKVSPVHGVSENGEIVAVGGTGAQKVADSLLSVCKLAAAGAIPV